jgi:N-dimethylarginine dimethylaminohydrolase
VEVADMPHYRGPADVFHLLSVLSPIDRDLALVYSPLMPIRFRDRLIGRGGAGFSPFVIPAKAGIQGPRPRRLPWIPAFAGMTEKNKP